MEILFDHLKHPCLQLSAMYAEEKSASLKVKSLSNSIQILDGRSQLVEVTEFSALLRIAKTLNLLPSSTDIVQISEVEHWINFSINILGSNQHTLLHNLNSKLESKSFLVGGRFSIADIALFATLASFYRGPLDSYQNIKRYFDQLLHTYHSFAKFCGENVMTNKSNEQPGKAAVSNAPKARKQEGKYIDLPGAEMGKVVVRFPPEASGYLHIGHAKAALLNQYYQQNFEGKLILRFDDTNPAKETEHFEEIILEDLKKLGVKYDVFTRSSDHFDKLLAYCEQLIKQGDAYVDSTDAETMRKERELRQESKCRNQSVAENLRLWEEMKKGSELGQQCCVRAKLDMTSDNGCLRDPTMYRCKNEEHVSTGNKYKVYPTYDFTCPIVDSVEGVTHALRTTEYHDRDDQYYWFIDKLGLRKPHIWEYSRLNLQNTVMSKRKLTWLVDNGYVTGWDDPRLPTVRGVFRRGMTVEGLKEFVIAQGSSTKVVTMDWSKIWAFNKQVIDPVAPRFVAVLKENVVEVTIDDAEESSKKYPKHPKNAAVGEKTVWYSKKILIDQADAAAIKEGETVTFVNWGNSIVKKITKKPIAKPDQPLIDTVECKLNLENTDFKSTQKFTWLANTPAAPLIPTVCVHFGPLLSKTVLAKDDDFKDCVNKDSLFKFEMLGEPGLADLKKGDIIQLMRRGYYIVDEPYQSPDPNTCKARPIVLFHVPDGHTKELPTGVTAASGTSTAVPTTTAKATPAVNADVISTKIAEQGNKIRQLKTDKAAKAAIDTEVQALLALKTEYKTVTGKDWTPDTAPAKVATAATGSNADAINAKIVEQGNKIRQLKADKAAKAMIDVEVQALLVLKTEYKTVTGKDWSPDAAPAKPAPASNNADAINAKIAEQGNKIRQLKTEKAAKAVIDAEVQALLALKTEYKTITGKEWTPNAATVPTEVSKQPEPAKNMTGGNNEQVDKLNDEIAKQGEKIRQLKLEKADKAAVDAEVKTLLALKADYAKLAGKDWAPATGGAEKRAEKPKAEAKKPEPKKEETKKEGEKKVTKLGIEAKKEEDFAEWYSQVITKSELIEYYDISGCYVLRPTAYAIWERIQGFFDAKIKALGVENCYFPLFVSKAALEREKTHISDFAPEVAWVTKSGGSDLAEPIAIRPTSETVMYPAFARWVQSYRDLPIRLNQWCSVVRWEFKNPQPFIRTREFLWQEGHSAFATKEEATQEVFNILDLYAQVYETLLAIPVVKGKKTLKERFAGADFTTTTELYIPMSGRGLQGATSHHLGQNFSKMFGIEFEDPENPQQKKNAFQNSWGISTRSIGALVMIHGDNNGLVLPPRVAITQVVVVPVGVTAQTTEEKKKELYAAATKLTDTLTSAGIRAKTDLREHVTPGWKFNHWELKGIPIRVEVGPRDLEKGEYVLVRRDTGEKASHKLTEAATTVNGVLEAIHKHLYDKAKAARDAHTTTCHEWGAFCEALAKRNVILAPFCGAVNCEEQIKDESAKAAQTGDGTLSMGAKSLCIPFEQAALPAGAKCINPRCTAAPSTGYTLFGRSY